MLRVLQIVCMIVCDVYVILKGSLRKLTPVLSQDNSGTISWCYFMVGAEIVPPNSLSDRNKKILDGTVF
jgi:hypothetical protein